MDCVAMIDSQRDEHTDWLTISEAIQYLKISKSTLYECMSDGRLPYYYVKGTRQRRLKKADVDSLMVRGAPEDPAEEE